MNRIAKTMVLATALAAPSGMAQAQVITSDDLAAEARAMGPVGPMGRSAAGMSVALPTLRLQEDPGNEIYREARAAMNQRDYRDAARKFRELRRSFPESGYVADAFYFEAFALYRAGSERQLKRALDVLEEQAEEYPEASTRGDAQSLRVRIEGALAGRGDPESTARVRDQAGQSCEDSDDSLRATALNALLNMDADRAMPILREVLRDRDECSEELRKQAVFLLSQSLTDETVDILLDLAHRDPDPSAEVREAAVFWLSQVDSEEALAALESILRSSIDSDLQEKAVFAISQHDSQRAGRILREYALRDDASGRVRENAIFWLGQRDDADAVDFLEELFEQLNDGDLKESVIFAMSQQESNRSRRWLLDRAMDRGEDIEVRKNALFWAGQSGLRAAEMREMYAVFEDREMKEQAIFAISQDDSREAVDILMEIGENDPDPEMQEKAIFWLGQSDDPRVADFLLRLLTGGRGSSIRRR